MFKLRLGGTSKNANNEWNNPNNFALALICWSIGITNMWKFPELIYKYGNISVVIPYLVVGVLMMIPLIFAELIIGQYTNRGPCAMWMMGPIWKGVGWASSFILFLTTTYTHYLTTQALYYVIKSFAVPLPWAYCNTKNMCQNLSTIEKLKERCLDTSRVNCTIDNWTNSVEYFFNITIMQSASSEFVTGINWLMIISSLISLIFTYLCMYDLIRSMERLLSLLTLIPFLELVVLMLTSLLYRGSFIGVSKFLRPNFHLLINPTLWMEVFNLSSFSMGIGVGGLIAISSHSNFRTNIYAMSCFIPILGLFTNLLFTIFVYSCFAGYARGGNLSVDELFKYDKSLIFVKLPMVLLKWPYQSNIWSLIYFTHLYLLGFRNTLFLIFTMVKVMNDGWTASNVYRKSTVCAVCIIIFFSGLIYYTNVGFDIFLCLDKLCSGAVLSLVIALEYTGIFYVYGINNLLDDLHFMLNIKPSIMKYYWNIVPIFILLILIFNMFVWFYTKHIKWIFVIGNTIIVIPAMLWLIHFLGHWVYNRNRSFKTIFGPHSNWGNVNLEMRKARDVFKNEAVDDEFTYRKELYSVETKDQ